jgi:hypothetical protein
LLNRLLEVLLIEALRAGGIQITPLACCGDWSTYVWLRRCGAYTKTQRAWTVANLAKEAALLRSTFFERFSRAF